MKMILPSLPDQRRFPSSRDPELDESDGLDDLGPYGAAQLDLWRAAARTRESQALVVFSSGQL